MTGKMTAALAAACACALYAPAFALNSDPDVVVEGTRGVEVHRVTVSMAGLDLAADSGVRWADARLSKASKKVCGWVQGTVLPETRDYRTCVDGALNGARVDLARMVDARRG
jgi:UrcA family protein